MDDKMNESLELREEANEEGASLVEYALLVALIAVICIIAVRTVGQKASLNFSNISNEL